jgi:hypothetical protein
MTVERSMLTVLLALVVCLVFAGQAVAKPSEHPFEIVPGSFHFTPSSYQAGAHANWVTSLDFAHEPDGQTYNDVRNISVEVPAGFDASDTAVPTCTQAQLFSPNPVATNLSDCPVESQVGTISVEVFCHPERQVVCQLTEPVYNMEVTSFGVSAELGFKIGKVLTQILQVSVRPNDVGLTATTPNIENVGETRNIKFTLWGIPGSHEHDAERGMLCGNQGEIPPVCNNEFGGPQEVNGSRPFLSNPSGCGMFHARMSAFSWQTPSDPTYETAEVGPIVECERVRFDPAIEASPSTRSAESPTGLDLSTIVPQTWENQFTIATSNLMGATVTLPEGMTANPSLAAGLGACTVAQYESETSSSLPGEGCPAESKIGSITIQTPILNETIPGAIYIATPYDNDHEFGDSEHPNGSLLALYVVAKDPERGLLLKVAGKITPNEHTGQLVTTFARQPSLNGGPGLEGLPQQPFSKFSLEFRSGPTAPLVSPPTCGSYAVTGELTPWSAPTEPQLIASQPFQITQGVHEGPCPTAGVPPFKPQVISGTQNNDGGTYSPFYLRIIREDGEQELIKFSTTLPPGLTGNLTGIPFCPDANIEAAKLVSGAEEEEHPSCPLASEIGHTIVEAGVGTVLAQNPGKVYLGGPYHGAPLSVVSITSAKVGPFDLGTVVIRFALDINTITGQVEISGAQSDPIPHILKGIVVHVRDIRVYMDRSDFTLNPTDCASKNITDTIVGSGSNYANPANEDSVNVNTPFEAADCASLQFKPAFKVSTTGKTSRRTGAGLSVDLTMPGALGTHSNIRSVKVDLPKQLPSRLTTLQKACTNAQFEANPSGCPSASKVGFAVANTPILPVPLEGPAYFVSHGGAKFPELIIVLQGYGFTIDLHGETFINKAGITSSTFHTIPDEPVGSFKLTLPQGEDSALAANGNLCTSKLTMPTAFVAQNGAEIHQTTKITATGCSKIKKTTKKTKGKKHKSKHAKKK